MSKRLFNPDIPCSELAGVEQRILGRWTGGNLPTRPWRQSLLVTEGVGVDGTVGSSFVHGEDSFPASANGMVVVSQLAFVVLRFVL
jgi:hypothetical protein